MGGLWRSPHLLSCSEKLEHAQGLQGTPDFVLKAASEFHQETDPREVCGPECKARIGAECKAKVGIMSWDGPEGES